MEKVKQLVDAGSSIPTAIKEALAQKGLSVAGFAVKHRLIRATVANHLNGSRRVTDDTVNALIAELGGTEDDWRELLWYAARPVRVTA